MEKEISNTISPGDDPNTMIKILDECTSLVVISICAIGIHYKRNSTFLQTLSPS